MEYKETLKELTLNLMDQGRDDFSPEETVIMLEGLYYIVEELYEKGILMTTKDIQERINHQDLILNLCGAFYAFQNQLPNAVWPNSYEHKNRLEGIMDEVLITKEFNIAVLDYQNQPNDKNRERVLSLKNTIEARYSKNETEKDSILKGVKFKGSLFTSWFYTESLEEAQRIGCSFANVYFKIEDNLFIAHGTAANETPREFIETNQHTYFLVDSKIAPKMISGKTVYYAQKC